MNIDALRAQLENLNTEIADLMAMDPVALARQVGSAADDPLFLYGIVGGKDVGKTSIINQLAGANISLDTDLLDEGTHIAVAYCHQQDRRALKKRFVREAGDRIKVVTHDRNELKNVVLMDFPDFDSRFLSHRDDVRRLRRYLQGLVWVTTPRKYGDYEFLNQLQSIAQSHDNYIIILNKIGAKVEDRKVVLPAREAAKEAEKSGKGNAGIFCGASIELHDGTIIKGKNSPLMHASSSLILNATKHLAGLPDNMYLLPKSIIDSITHLKKNVLNRKEISLDVDETLIALGISASSNPAAQLALENLIRLRNCEAHLTHIPTSGDEAGLRKLKINLTCDPEYSSKSLFISG